LSLQLQLTPTEETAARFNLDNLPVTKEGVEEYMKSFVEGQIELSRRNKKMRDRFISLAEEAAAKNII